MLGRLVTQSEVLGRLIDPTALEVSFRVSGAQYARLLDARGALRPAEVTVTLDLDGSKVAARGRLARE